MKNSAAWKNANFAGGLVGSAARNGRKMVCRRTASRTGRRAMAQG